MDLRETIFNIGAAFYDELIWQDFWIDHIEGLVEHAGPSENLERILDLGCGPGVSALPLARRLPKSTVIGVDLAEKMIEKAKKHQRERFAELTNVKFEVGNAYELPYADGSFGFVLGHSFLYLVPDPERALHEAYRVLKPGGKLVLVDPNADANLISVATEALANVGELGSRPDDSIRFILSMFFWRVASSVSGQLTAQQVAALTRGAGFTNVSTHESLGGLGVLCVAEAA